MTYNPINEHWTSVLENYLKAASTKMNQIDQFCKENRNMQ